MTSDSTPHATIADDVGPFPLASTFAHLGLGATVTTLPGFDWSPATLEDYDRRFASDGNEGRLLGVVPIESDWQTWERHPHGAELVLLLSGRADFVQLIDGQQRVIPLTPGTALVNPPGVWHTARVHESGELLFITPGRKTEHATAPKGC